MSRQACKVLYAKYNSTRKPDYRIITEICEDSRGLFVRKRAGEAAAEAHLEQICVNSADLQKYYQNATVISSVREGEELRFPYINGQTLAEQIETRSFDKAHFVEDVKDKLAAVLSIDERYFVPFESTPAFESMFGKAGLWDTSALNPANIDSLFTNFIENDSGIYSIDCEWVCRFPVPVKYIKYRTLRYFYLNEVSSKLNGVALEEMLGWFDFSEEELEVCWEMEKSFQQYIHGRNWKYIYTERYKKKNLSLDKIEHEIRNLKADISLKEGMIHDKDVHINNLERFVHDKDVHINNLECFIHDKDNHIYNLDNVISDRDGLIGRLENAVYDKDAHIKNLEGIIHDKDDHIDNLENVLSDKDESIKELKDAASDKDARIKTLEDAASDKDARIKKLENAVYDKDVHIRNLDSIIHDKDTHIDNQNSQIQKLTVDYQTMTNAFFWRITKPARAILDGLKGLIKKNETLYILFRAVKDTMRHGVKFAKQRRADYYRRKERILQATSWPSEVELARQREQTFSKEIKFSILVPLYNTPERFLRAMIQSVQDQTYPKWELCLADGSDSEHGDVKKICMELARKDKRIKYLKLKKNEGISENTNACLKMSSGEYCVLFDHDDLLHPSALYENMKVICQENADFIYSDENTFHETPSDAYWPHFKPDFAPDTLRSYNYICHLTVFKTALLDEIGGGFRSRFDGSQDYDMVLRLTEKARHIVHIPKVLYYWRGHAGSVASDISAKSYTIDAAKAALAEHLDRVGLKGTVKDSVIPSTYKIQYAIEGSPLISIVIPNMDHVDDLKKCIDSIIELSTWKNLEVIVVENNSKKEETFEYYKSIERNPRIRIVKWNGGFNFSAICNQGAKAAKGDYILLLNNDIQVITPDWLEQMLMFAQRSDVGAVGAMLYYPDDTIQHAGVILGIGGVAGHSHKYFKRGDYGYASRLTIAQNFSAVTAACILIPKHVWKQVKGLDEGFAVAFNDVDLCLRIRKAGYLIVWTPYAELYHFESKSRGYEDTIEKQKRFKGEIDRFNEKWDDFLSEGDPYYNPNLTLEREDFSLR